MPESPLPTHRVSALRSWYQRLPARTRKIGLIVTTVIVALVLRAVVIRWYHHSQPEYVIEKINQLHSSEEVRRNRDYFTPQGLAVYLHGAEHASNKPMSKDEVTFADPIISGNTCDIGIQAKDWTGSIRLLKTDHWRFHDIYLNRYEDKDVGLWASYVKDHPYATGWKMLWK